MKATVIIPSLNGGENLISTVDALSRQLLPDQHSMHIIVVDDGSQDDSASQVEQRFGPKVQVLRSLNNRGRSMARNVGADAAPIGTKILIFIDADCIPAHPNFVANHIAEFETGAELAFGGIDVPGEGFWTLLQRKINATRRERFLSGDPLAFTSANFSIKRELFQRHGGFDLAFGRYGFEDRDLFARLEDSGIRGRYALDAPVIHMDSQSLRSICEKQSEAGLHGASIFRARHLRAYRAMGASRMDSDLHQWLRIVDKFFWPVAQRVAALPDSWLEWAWVPFGIRSTLARFVYSLHFLHGTCQKYKC